jgi:phage shock protein A
VSRFEDRIRHQEAMAQGMEEVNSSSLDDQFANLDSAERTTEVDARLAALKGGKGS